MKTLIEQIIEAGMKSGIYEDDAKIARGMGLIPCTNPAGHCWGDLRHNNTRECLWCKGIKVEPLPATGAAEEGR